MLFRSLPWLFRAEIILCFLIISKAYSIFSCLNFSKLSTLISSETAELIFSIILKSLELIESEEGQKRRAHLHHLIEIWKNEMVFNEWGKRFSNTPIQPVILGSNANALFAAKRLDETGYWIPAIRPPTVPNGSARLRITFSANHTEDDLRQLIQQLKQIEQERMVQAS